MDVTGWKPAEVSYWQLDPGTLVWQQIVDSDSETGDDEPDDGGK